LQDAIREKVLCPYSYSIVPCNFEADEAEEYVRLSAHIGSLVGQYKADPDPAKLVILQATVSRRTRLLGSLRNKNHRLEEVLKFAPRTPHTLIYCGEGAHPLDAAYDVEAERNVDLTIGSLSSFGWRVSRVTAHEAAAERRQILSNFTDGTIDAVAAIRVLDEGFDIPSCRHAYLLASSTSHRQYVQRRGRVLRQSPGKHIAAIADFIPLPTITQFEENREIWKKQIANELIRIREFAELSTNPDDARTEFERATNLLNIRSDEFDDWPQIEDEVYDD